MLQSIEVFDKPADHRLPAVNLEAVPKRQAEEVSPGPNGSGNGRPCGGRHAPCGQRQVAQSAPQHHEAPPPYLEDLLNRYHLVGWMEDNLQKAHQAVRESEDAAYASVEVRSSLVAFLDVVEEVMFRCKASTRKKA